MFVIPLCLRTDYILTLWLKTVPDYAIIFTQLSFLIIILDALSTPLYFLMLATGDIRNYQLVAGSLGLITFPLTWIGLKLGMDPTVAYYVLFLVDIFRWIIQLYFLNRIARFDIHHYLKDSMIPILVVSIICVVLSVVINNLFPQTFVGLLAFVITSTMILCITIYMLGLNKSEKAAISNIVMKKIRKE